VPRNLHKGSLFLGDYAEIVRVLVAANPDAADRFCDAVENAIALLAEHPELGVKAGFRHAPQVRRWVIQKFPNSLIFYQPHADGVLFIRLLHGARELPPLIPPH
jgi:plasmid stabilization system protein ParE